MTQLATISPAECDKEELVCLTEALAAENQELRALLAKQNPPSTKLDVLKARLGLHFSGSAALYSLGAAAAFGHNSFFDHPQLAAVVGSLNLLAWTITSAILRFDSTPAGPTNGATRTGPR